VPGGESYEDVAGRAERWVHSLKADTFAITHGAFTRILRGLFTGLDAQEMSDLDEPQGVVFRVRGNRIKRFDKPS
jgi:probable phosphoglycerate mutase